MEFWSHGQSLFRCCLLSGRDSWDYSLGFSSDFSGIILMDIPSGSDYYRLKLAIEIVSLPIQNDDVPSWIY